MVRFGHQKHSFNRRIQLPVHSNHLIFIFKVLNSAQSAQNYPRTNIAGAVNQ